MLSRTAGKELNLLFLAVQDHLLNSFSLRTLLHPCVLGNCSCVALPPASMQSWIPAQICLEQVCINPKGVRQDSLT